MAAHADTIETQGRIVVPFIVKNGAPAIEFTAIQASDAAGTVRISASQPGATAIAIRQNNREVGRIAGEAGEIEIPATTLGRGPVALQAVTEGPASTHSRPISLQIR